MFAEERQGDILELLKNSRKISVNELYRKYGVSKTTIRSDLKALEDADLIVKTHGGAILKTKNSFELHSEKRKSINHDKKQHIGQLAAQHIHDNETILLDTGTTTLQLAYALKGKQNLTVITNDMDIANVLEEFEGIEIIMLGGVIKKGYHCTFQINSHSLINQLNIDKAFMASNAFSIEKGASVADIRLSETKRQMIKQADIIYLLCDDSKFNQSALAQFASTKEIDHLITNKKPALEQQLIDLGVGVIYSREV